MQIHIIDLHYLVTQEEAAKIRPSHRNFLDMGLWLYTNGIFLTSRPKTSKTGGVIIARGECYKRSKNLSKMTRFILIKSPNIISLVLMLSSISQNLLSSKYSIHHLSFITKAFIFFYLKTILL